MANAEREEELLRDAFERRCISTGADCNGYSSAVPDPQMCKQLGCCFYTKYLRCLGKASQLSVNVFIDEEEEEMPTQIPPFRAGRLDIPTPRAPPHLLLHTEKEAAASVHPIPTAETEDGAIKRAREEACPTGGLPCPGFGRRMGDENECTSLGCCWYSDFSKCYAKASPGQSATASASLQQAPTGTDIFDIKAPLDNDPQPPPGVSRMGVERIFAEAQLPDNLGEAEREREQENERQH